MKLDAVYGQILVLDSHDYFLEFSGLFEAFGHFYCAEAVVSACLEGVFDSCEHSLFVVRDS